MVSDCTSRTVSALKLNDWALAYESAQVGGRKTVFVASAAMSVWNGSAAPLLLLLKYEAHVWATPLIVPGTCTTFQP